MENHENGHKTADFSKTKNILETALTLNVEPMDMYLMDVSNWKSICWNKFAQGRCGRRTTDGRQTDGRVGDSIGSPCEPKNRACVNSDMQDFEPVNSDMQDCVACLL